MSGPYRPAARFSKRPGLCDAVGHHELPEKLRRDWSVRGDAKCSLRSESQIRPECAEPWTSPDFNDQNQSLPGAEFMRPARLLTDGVSEFMPTNQHALICRRRFSIIRSIDQSS